MFLQNVGVSGEAVRCESRAWKFARRASSISRDDLLAFDLEHLRALDLRIERHALLTELRALRRNVGGFRRRAFGGRGAELAEARIQRGELGRAIGDDRIGGSDERRHRIAQIRYVGLLDIFREPACGFPRSSAALPRN